MLMLARLCFRHAFRKLGLLSEDRPVMSLEKMPYAMTFFVPYFIMAYLARRDGTYLMRLLLLPVVVAMTLHCAFGYKWEAQDEKTVGCAHRECPCSFWSCIYSY